MGQSGCNKQRRDNDPRISTFAWMANNDDDNVVMHEEEWHE
jgi:hypothetical protein